MWPNSNHKSSPKLSVQYVIFPLLKGGHLLPALIALKRNGPFLCENLCVDPCKPNVDDLVVAVL